MENLTAKMCLFVKAYHSENSNIKIYFEKNAKTVLGKDYDTIYNNLKTGINFFDSKYQGNDPVKHVVNRYLAPTIFARSAFNERCLNSEIRLGLKQYVLLASGYDLSSLKYNNMLKIFELDKESVLVDKENLLKKNNIDIKNINYVKSDLRKDFENDLLSSGFNPKLKSHITFLGISYYLSKKEFASVINKISNIMCSGSSLVIDYPNERYESKNKILALGAGKEMQSKYSYKDIQKIASKNGLLIYEHLTYTDINKDFFYDYNTLNPNCKIVASDDTQYVLLIKK